MFAFGLFLWRFWQPLTRSQPDNAAGCAEPVATEAAATREFAC